MSTFGNANTAHVKEAEADQYTGERRRFSCLVEIQISGARMELAIRSQDGYPYSPLNHATRFIRLLRFGECSIRRKPC